MNRIRIFLSVLALATLLAFTFVTPARAFDGRTGDRVVIASNEVIDDDLYVGATEFILDGTVNGDLIVVGQTITINGTVNGDLFTAGSTLIINGVVKGAVRMAGSVLFVSETASIGEDFVGAGYSLEVRKGSEIGRDLAYAGGQLVLGGDVVRNVYTGVSAFKLLGTVGGNVRAELGSTDQTQTGFMPTMFMPQSPITAPVVPLGLTIDPAAHIRGNLEYAQDKQMTLPDKVVSGKTNFRLVTPTVTAVTEPSFTAQVSLWLLNFVRNSIAHILVGLLLLWLFPTFVKGLSETLKTRFWPSLGWGAVSWVGFVVALLLVLFATIVGGIVFGTLSLGQITGTVIWLGILALMALVIGFVLTTTFLAEVVFGTALGRWILARSNSPLAEHRYWPMVIGLLITLTVVALLSFPAIPSFFGWLVNFAIVLFGLGTLWIWGRDRLAHRAV